MLYREPYQFTTYFLPLKITIKYMLSRGIEGGISSVQQLTAESISNAVRTETVHFLTHYPWLVAGFIILGAAIKIADDATDSGVQRFFSRRFVATQISSE